jgi:outer membrane PBP1 activator LpoA protein
MKKSLILFTAAALLLAVATSSCESPSSRAEKVEDAKKDLTQAKKDLDKATKAYLADVEKYRVEAAAKVTANEKSIAGFKARIAMEKEEVRADYEKKIDALEEKNTDMKKAMDDYKIEGKEKWESFKTEFSHDMDELGKAFRDLTVKNVK